MAGSNVVQCVGPSYHLADVKAAVQSAINCLPRRLEGDKWIQESAEGTEDIGDFVDECRGARRISSRWFVVSGSYLYETQTDGTKVLRGTLSTSSGAVSIAHNTTQVAIVDGPYLYIFTLSTNGFVQVSSPAWRGSDNVDEMDGYFIFAEPGTDQWYISAIDDGTALDALDFTSADAAPDILVGHVVSHHQLWIGGEKSTEIWVNSGGADFPFTRYNAYPIDIGWVGPQSFCLAADTLFFVGKTERGTAIVYQVQGNQPTPISNSAIEELLLASTDLSKTRMFAYQPKGHEYVFINAPGMKTTVVYDARHKQWHERGEWVDGDWQPLDWVFATSIGIAHYGGSVTGKAFRIDASLNQLSGRHLVRERTWPHFVSASLEPISFHGLQASLKTGYGGNITLEISKDAGNNFMPKLLRSLGATGRWMQIIRWLGLGTAYNIVFRLRCSDNVPFTIYSATVESK
jgi:hypothetical protein